MKSIIKLAACNKSAPLLQTVYFDGVQAIATNLSIQLHKSCLQPALTRTVCIDVDTVKGAMALSKTLTLTDETINGLDYTARYPADEFPLLHLENRTCIAFTELYTDTLKKLLLASGKTDIRHYLNGLFFDFDHGAIVGCDGHRVHWQENSLPIVKGIGSILPLFASELAISEKAFDVYLWGIPSNTGKAYTRIFELTLPDGGHMWVKEVDGKFPDYLRVIPTEHNSSVTFSEVKPLKESLEKIRAFHKVSIFKWHGVKFSFTEKTASVPDKVSFPLPHHMVNGEPLHEIGFNVAYILDVLKCVTENAVWSFRTGNDSTRITCGDFNAVVMPMRI